ncbi:MAG: hypothetical protein Q9211_001991 [Gyalolechia sp. 1 TL-2023]
MASSTRAAYQRNHEPSFRAACMKIDQAVQRGLLNSQTLSKYTTVGVLMMHWDNDDIGVEPLEQDLATVFSELYNFNVETFVIPSHPQTGNVMNIMNRRLMDFTARYEGPRSLLIYVYSGHADAGPPPLYDQCVWHGTTAIPLSHCPKLNWAANRVNPDNAEGDTLYILDCCYATTAAIDKSDNEYLVSASMESQAGAALHNSFTKRLINLLKESAGAPQSVVSIHATLIANMKSTNAGMEATPIHIGGKSKPSIVLERLAKTPKDVQAVKMSDTTGAGKILISVALQGQASIPDAQHFEDWLLSKMPPNLASVKVEAVFQASSQIVLFTVPVEVWDCLEGTGAFTFIDHVDSHNLLLESRALPIIQKQVGYDENKPPRPSTSGKN